jgi:hypothetical protein
MMMMTKDGARDGWEALNDCTAADPAGGACLMQLLHLQVAWSLQALHSKLKGKSPITEQPYSSNSTRSSRASSSSSSSRSRQQQQQLEVPCFHEQYLAALGAPNGKLTLQGIPPPIEWVAVAHSFHVQVLRAGCDRNSSSSSSSSTASWRSLQRVGLPSLEQQLLLLEAALLDPFECCGEAVGLFCDTVTGLRMHKCLRAAAPLLLPPVLHLLGPIVAYVMPHPEQLEGFSMEEVCADYWQAVSQLLMAGARWTHLVRRVCQLQCMFACSGLCDSCNCVKCSAAVWNCKMCV